MSVADRRCAYPKWEPSKGNPGGDCRAGATKAAPLGSTGLHLALCPPCSEHRVDAVPIEQVEEP